MSINFNTLNCAISVKRDRQGFCNTIVNGKLRVKQTARIEKTLAVEENLEVYKDVNIHGSIDVKEITTDDLTVNNQLTAENIDVNYLKINKTVYPKLEAYSITGGIEGTIALNQYLPFFGFTATKNTNTTNGFTASTGTGLQNSFIYTGTTASTFNVKYSISLEENTSTGAIYETVLLKNGLTASPYFSSFCKHNMTTVNTTKLFHGSAYINLSPNDFIDVRILNSGSGGQITIFSYSLSAHDMNLSQ